MNIRYRVTLTAEERSHLAAVVRQNSGVTVGKCDRVRYPSRWLRLGVRGRSIVGEALPCRTSGSFRR
jgi:hypothetical protein